MKPDSSNLTAHSGVRTYGDVALRFRRSNALGFPVGEAHHNARYSDALVAKARELRAQGMSHRAIGRALGLAWQTCFGWTSMRRRLPHARVIVTRVRLAHTAASSGAKRGQACVAAERTPEPTSFPTPTTLKGTSK